MTIFNPSSNPSPQPVLDLAQISHHFMQGAMLQPVLEKVSCQVQAGEMVGLVGPSGSGKSTLLHIAGLLLRPSAGSVRIAGELCSLSSDTQCTRYRRDTIGFVYQFHHLLHDCTVLQNVMLPRLIQRIPYKQAQLEAEIWLERCGLLARAKDAPYVLSGGQQQRVSLARALVHRPRLLLADEPTGNLDPDTAYEMMELLRGLVHSEAIAAMVTTHHHALARMMDRVMTIAQRTLSVWVSGG